MTHVVEYSEGSYHGVHQVDAGQYTHPIGAGQE